MAITGTLNTKATLKRYPVTSGLTSETTKQKGRTSNLVPQNSNVAKRDKIGL